MPDPHETVDAIRFAVDANGKAPMDGLNGTFEDYAKSCREVNDRLRWCSDLLQRGLRGEAIQQAELEPNLLELVTALDMPEREKVVAFCREHKLSIPAAIAADVAADLNAAYAQQQPIETHLRRHRLLALAQAALKSRIAVLRKLAESDEGNPIWREDVISYETTRLSQLRAEADQAADEGNLKALEAIWAELRPAKWFQLPPPSLVRQVEEQYERVRRRHAYKQLKRIQNQLHKAFQELDGITGRRLRREWDEHIAVAEPGADDPVVQAAHAALDWLDLDDEERAADVAFQRDLAALESGLDQDEPLEELRRLYRDLARHQRDLPSHLMTHYHAKVNALTKAATRRFRLVAGTISAAFVAALLLSFVAWSEWQFRGELDRVMRQLTELLDAHEFAAARSLVERLEKQHQSVYADPSFQTLVEQLFDREHSEQDRAKRFQQYIDAAENELEVVVASLEEFAAAQLHNPPRLRTVELEEAQRLQRTPNEKKLVADIQAQFDEAQKALTSRADGLFLGELQRSRDRFRRLASAPKKDSPTWESQLHTVKAGLRLLKTMSSATSDGVKQRLAELDQEVLLLEREAVEDKGAVDVTEAVGNAVAYPIALDEYRVLSSLTAEYVLAEQHLWKWLLEDYNGFAAQWNKLAPQAWEPSTAAELVTISTDWIQKSGTSPHAALVTESLTYLKSIAVRVDNNKLIVEAIRDEFLKKPFLYRCLVLKVRDIKRYTTNDYRTHYIQRFRPQLDRVPLLRQERMQGWNDAPHSAIVRDSIDVLESYTHRASMIKKWELAWVESISPWVNDESVSEIDPVIRLYVLHEMLATACRGSFVLDEALREHLNVLEGVSELFVGFFDQLPATDQSRILHAQRQLVELAPISETCDAAIERAPQSFPMLPYYEWIGWLRPRASGLTCELKGNHRQGDLYVVHSGTESTPGLTKIGHVTSDGMPVLEMKSDPVQAGRPVFFVPSTPD